MRRRCPCNDCKEVGYGSKYHFLLSSILYQGIVTGGCKALGSELTPLLPYLSLFLYLAHLQVECPKELFQIGIPPGMVLSVRIETKDLSW